MTDLLLDVLTLDETRLKRRLFGFVFSLVVPVLFLGLSFLWASVLAFVWLSENNGELVAAVVMAVVSLGLALGAFIVTRLFSLGRRRQGLRDSVLARLSTSSNAVRGAATDDLLAFALLVANHIDAAPKRKL